MKEKNRKEKKHFLYFVLDVALSVAGFWEQLFFSSML
jgi:hypothetical protein